MIKITKISYTNKTRYYGIQEWDKGKIFPFRINFVRNGLHYSLNVAAGNYSDVWHSVYLHCKETKEHQLIDIVDSCTLHDYIDPKWKIGMPYSHYNLAYLERLFLPNFVEMVNDRKMVRELYIDLLKQRNVIFNSERVGDKVSYVLGELHKLTDRIEEELNCNPKIARTNSSYPFQCNYEYSIRTKDGYVVCGDFKTQIACEWDIPKEENNFYLVKESENPQDVFTTQNNKRFVKYALKRVIEKFNSLPDKKFYIHVEKVYHLDDFSEWRNK